MQLNVSFPGGPAVKNLPANARAAGLIPGSGRPPLEKEIATYSSTLAWKIPWAEEPGGLQSMKSQRVGLDLGTKQQQQQIVECSKNSISRIQK